MKLGVVGKGGVGKTTVAALLARFYVGLGRQVLIIETDSNPNLGVSLGLTAEQAAAVPTLPRRLLVGEPAGTDPEQVISDYGRPTPAGATLLCAIEVTEAGAGCTCAGHASVRSFLAGANSEGPSVTLVDMEAGLEHLSRSGGTLAYADVLVAVMEPTTKSVLTAARTAALAEQLGIERTVGLANKVRSPDDGELLRRLCADQGIELLGALPFETSIADADRSGRAVDLEAAPAVRDAIRLFTEQLEPTGGRRPAR